ncbi:glycosyltransferase family protein [Nisaea sediminum]|uniref:hypothetical protein n=1 Tax=Nisaea sediminum TaxID=2775867 RepID=UPI001866F99C|nr:hypothetical protein [Nisaea sediminum]
MTYARVSNRNGKPVFSAAGNRLRLVPAYHALAAKGAAPVIFAGADEEDILANSHFRESDQVLFGKVVRPMPELVEFCRRRGKRIVFDFCDDPWDYPELRPTIDAGAEADLCTTSSDGLARKLRSRLGVTVEVVKEPPDCAYGAPRVAPDGDKVRLLWFGSDSNADSLGGLVETLMPLTSEHKLELTMIGGDRRAYEPVLAAATPHFSILFREWELGLLDRAMKRSDIVLIPKRDGPWSRLKSENRLVTSLAGGRIAVAGTIESYEKLADWCVLTNDFRTAVEDILERPKLYRRKVKAGQKHVRRHYDPAVIRRHWRKILS